MESKYSWEQAVTGRRKKAGTRSLQCSGRERKSEHENKRIFDGELTAKCKAKHPWMWTLPKKGQQFSKAAQTETSIQD